MFAGNLLCHMLGKSSKKSREKARIALVKVEIARHKGVLVDFKVQGLEFFTSSIISVLLSLYSQNALPLTGSNKVSTCIEQLNFTSVALMKSLLHFALVDDAWNIA